ncbi:MAG: ribosomal-processing cysteine protease Prp [Eubacterium sp.]
MIKAEVYKDSDGVIRGFKISGHADYAEAGADIVCSAVSALAINAVNSVNRYCDDEFDLNTSPDGLIEFKFKNDEISYDAVLFMKSLNLGLKTISQQYENYIKKTYKEV